MLTIDERERYLFEADCMAKSDRRAFQIEAEVRKEYDDTAESAVYNLLQWMYHDKDCELYVGAQALGTDEPCPCGLSQTVRIFMRT